MFSKLLNKPEKVETPQKELCDVCCGNCEEFHTHNNGWGYCPEIYWPYDINRIREGWFCKNFNLAKRLRDKFRVDKKSRDPYMCLLEQLKRLGRKPQSAMNTSDCVMLTSTTDMSGSNASSGVNLFCAGIFILFLLFLSVYWLIIRY